MISWSLLVASAYTAYHQGPGFWCLGRDLVSALRGGFSLALHSVWGSCVIFHSYAFLENQGPSTCLVQARLWLAVNLPSSGQRTWVNLWPPWKDQFLELPASFRDVSTWLLSGQLRGTSLYFVPSAKAKKRSSYYNHTFNLHYLFCIQIWQSSFKTNFLQSLGIRKIA